MRTWLVWLITVVAMVIWYWLRTFGMGWLTFLFISFGFVLSLAVPVVFTSILLRRRRLGGWTSAAFIAQAAALDLASLLCPDTGDVATMAPIATILGHPSISNRTDELLLSPTIALAGLWVLLIPVTAVLAWHVEAPSSTMDVSGARAG